MQVHRFFVGATTGRSYKEKIPAPKGAGMETLFKLLDYSRVEKCLMVRHI